MYFKKVSVFVSMVLIISLAFSGCSEKETSKKTEGNVTITIANWPDDTKKALVEMYDSYVETMNEKYPEINIVPDSYRYDVRTFMAKASSNQLPTLFTTWFTEINKIIDAGFVADITPYMIENDYDKSLNPALLDLVTKNDKNYAVPLSTYAQGLFLNRNLFSRAGLINEDGTIQHPDTYEELARTAQIIKEKTGRAGFIFPATNNCGGWHFMNIAWSYGVEFMKKENDKWLATFNTKECVEALQYVKDLKWKYNVLPENIFIDQSEMMKLFATDQGAMCFLDPVGNGMIRDYGMNKDNISIARMPAGPKGRYTQMGGNVQMVAANSTPEQIDAVFKWLEITGNSPVVTDDVRLRWEKTFKQHYEDNWIVPDKEPFEIWINLDRVNARNQARSKYININPKNFESYYSFENVIINPEEPVATQELYNLLDSCIQEVITDENSNPATIIEKASNDFQRNYLDKIEE